MIVHISPSLHSILGLTESGYHGLQAQLIQQPRPCTRSRPDWVVSRLWVRVRRNVWAHHFGAGPFLSDLGAIHHNSLGDGKTVERHPSRHGQRSHSSRRTQRAPRDHLTLSLIPNGLVFDLALYKRNQTIDASSRKRFVIAGALGNLAMAISGLVILQAIGFFQGKGLEFILATSVVALVTNPLVGAIGALFGTIVVKRVGERVKSQLIR